MSEYQSLDLFDPVGFAIPMFVITVLAEMYLAKKSDKVSYEAKDSAASLIMGFGSQVIAFAIIAMTLGASVWAYNHRIFDLGTGILVFIACFFLEDLAYYWSHRISHEVRYFWASHIVHHSSQHYNLSTALRQTWTFYLSGGFVFWLPLSFLGFHPSIIILFTGFSTVYQYWVHTEAIDKMPDWVENNFNTPSNHRVHHATNPEYLDMNYAGILLCWDKMFGTYVKEDAKMRPKYGIVANLNTFNPFRIAVHEWVALIKDVKCAKNIGEILGFIFGSPGWRPDGTGRTTKKIRQTMQEIYKIPNK